MGGVLYGASIGIRFQKEASPTCKFTDKKRHEKERNSLKWFEAMNFSLLLRKSCTELTYHWSDNYLQH